jgi:hypothetical protein
VVGIHRRARGPGRRPRGRRLRSLRCGYVFLHDVDPEVAAEGEQYQRSEADVVFGLVCDFEAWPAIGIRVQAGDDDRFFPVGLQRRVSRDRLGVEADVLPGGHLVPLTQPRSLADYLLQTSPPRRQPLSSAAICR